MKPGSLVVVLILVASLSACAFVPETADDQRYADSCEMHTKKLTLTVKEIGDGFCENGNDVEICLLTFGVIVPAGSLLLSGSVVLVGNTLHWLEYQGKCKVTTRSSSL